MHLPWCALVAMLTSWKVGSVASKSQENLFITRWFATAKKQRLFSREAACDIDWILSQGRMPRVCAQLRHKLDYLWRSCTVELSEQNDLYRLTCTLELGTQHDWVYLVVYDREWRDRLHIQPPAR